MNEEPGMQGKMEPRLTTLEKNVEKVMLDVAVLQTDVAVLKTDVAVVKATGATKTDLAELRFELADQIVKTQAELSTRIAESRSDVVAQLERLRADMSKAVDDGRLATILWVVSIVIVAHFLPAISKFVNDVF